MSESVLTAAATPMLAGLMAQASEEGASLITLRALIEEASELGAGRALRTVGMHDRAAAGDFGELREVLQAWRDAKRTARNAVISWTTRGIVAGLLGFLAVKLGLAALLVKG